MPILEILIGIALIIFGATTLPTLGLCVLFASFAGGYMLSDGLRRMARS